MKILIAGGGTGGHIYPAVAIANQIKYEHPDAEIVFAGRNDCMEADIVPKAGYELNNIRIYGFERYYSKLKKLSVFFKMFRGYNDARKLVNSFNPDIVIGTGGFVSGPVVLAGALKGKPTLIHEQNAMPGFTTRTLSKWADIVCSSFENTKEYVKHPERVVYTGNPVRREFGLYNREIARKTLGIDSDKKVIVCFGGSLGAKNLNDAMLSLIDEYKNDDDIYICHVTGKNGYEDFLENAKKKGLNFGEIHNVEIKDYVYDMPVLLNAADLVIARSGAGAIAEITYVGLAGIYVPYPLAADDHQRKNAEEVESAGAGIMILDDELNGDRLIDEVKKIICNESYFKQMSYMSKLLSIKDSAERIVDEVEKLTKNK